MSELTESIELCRALAGEFVAYWPASESARHWRQLATKLLHDAAGQPVEVTALDLELVKSMQLAVLRDPLAAGARERSRTLSRLLVSLCEMRARP